MTFALAHPYFRPPFKHEFGMIVDQDHHRMLDVRGWGYLTGTGALNLPHDQAAAIQDQIGTNVAALLTQHWAETNEITPEAKAFLDAALIQMQADRVTRAARAVIRSARYASTAQDLVLRDLLLELAREIGEPLHTA